MIELHNFNPSHLFQYLSQKPIKFGRNIKKIEIINLEDNIKYTK
jgi:hypothetical protein